MIDSTTAAKQLERLSGLAFFPKEAPAKKELRLAIECAITEAIAAAAVSEWLAESSQCPTPSEIRRLINAKQEQLIADRRSCELCGGAGWITVFRGGLSGARECECRKALVKA